MERFVYFVSVIKNGRMVKPHFHVHLQPHFIHVAVKISALYVAVLLTGAVMRFCQQRTVRVCIIWCIQHIDLSLLQQENFFLRSKSHFEIDLYESW